MRSPTQSQLIVGGILLFGLAFGAGVQFEALQGSNLSALQVGLSYVCGFRNGQLSIINNVTGLTTRPVPQEDGQCPKFRAIAERFGASAAPERIQPKVKPQAPALDPRP